VHNDGIRFVHQVRVYKIETAPIDRRCAVCIDPESFLENDREESGKWSGGEETRIERSPAPLVRPMRYAPRASSQL
jgi:hypothetical protein